jgi:hypothetical protein
MNREYVKGWIWEGKPITPCDQVYIFAKQSKNERTLIMNNLDFIVTDSPMALSIFYGEKYDQYEIEFTPCRLLLKQHHKFCRDNGYKTEHYFLVRGNEYQDKGRLQSRREALDFDLQMRVFMESLGIKYKTILCNEDTEEKIVRDVLGF